MAFVGTPAAEQCQEAVLSRFGFITRVGTYNRRYISGTTIWSQHSWANGKDFHLNTVEEGDKLYAWLTTRRKAFGIRTLLWRVNGHWNVPPPTRHLHADFWPRGTSTPPLLSVNAGYFMYSDGRVVRSKLRDIPAEGPGIEEPMSTLKNGDSGNAVAYYQKALNKWAGERDGFPIEVDGQFGPATEDAVRRYQRAADLTESGIISGVESYLIGRYELPQGKDGITDERVVELIESARLNVE